MKFRHTGGKGERITPDMAAMIDVVFQLLIFFMLTLKIVAQEGDFNINMPIGAPATDTTTDLEDVPRKVRLRADASGNLQEVLFDGTSLGSDPEKAFDELNRRVLQAIGGRPGDEMAKEVEVEIEADYQLHYRHVISAVGAVTGRLQKVGDDVKLIRYIEKIKFAPPKKAP